MEPMAKLHAMGLNQWILVQCKAAAWGLHTMEQGKPMALALGMAKMEKVDSSFATTAGSQVTSCSRARNWSVTCI